MASPIKVYHDGQTGAPTLSGEVGKTISVLDACLVNGYNAQVPTAINVSSNVVTVTSATHGYDVNDTIELSGVTDKTELNDEWRIESAAAGTFTFTSSTSTDGSASGTFATKIAPAGWSKPLTGTNEAAFRSNDITSGRFYLYLDDNTDANDTYASAFEVMQSISSGINQSPQYYWAKSDVSSSATRKWTLIADSQRFHYFVQRNITTYLGYAYYFFGDIQKLNSADSYATLMGGHTSIPSSPGSSTNMLKIDNSFSPTTGKTFIRDFGGTSMQSESSFWAMGPARELSGGISIIWPYDTVDGKLHLMPINTYCEDSDRWRGRLPGMLSSMESVGPGSVGHLETMVVDSVTLINVHAATQTSTNSYTGSVWFDIDGPWEY